ncbi:MAG TPA: 50S ribosomal protein L6 [Phycisphaerae bacterium]|nr:50S ribosomal protein L6 [Phycisphaerae bacterium]HUU22492.1 50S ribosomal protein L6 [Phycisphaerae bacterium]
MSRIGKQRIEVPANVKVAVQARTVRVEGPKGKLEWAHRPEVSVAVDEAGRTVTVTRDGDDRLSRALHGTTRALIANMVEGCLNGYSRRLEIYGVGYGVQVQGRRVMLTVGYAHPRAFEIPAGTEVTVTAPQARGESEPARFTVSGPDKQAVGELAARLRKARPPEPYKGKGVRYADEHVRRKAGKAFAGAGGV